MDSGTRLNQGSRLLPGSQRPSLCHGLARFAMKHTQDTGRETPKMTGRFQAAELTDGRGRSIPGASQQATRCCLPLGVLS